MPITGADEKDHAPPLEAGRRALDLRRMGAPEPAWLVPGVIAKGWMVQLSAREKGGKGTLVNYLLSRLERGDPTVFGPSPTHVDDSVSSLIYTEEPEDSLIEKANNFDLRLATIVFHWELQTLGTWARKAQWLVERAVNDGHGLIFVDNVSRATGTTEEAGTELARHVELLSDLAKPCELAVILDHHQRKSGGNIEDLFRGGTALAGATENNLAMVRVGDHHSRKRKIASRGRVMATIWERVFELDASDSDYLEVDADDFRTQVVHSKPQWTVKAFAQTLKVSDQTARSWLNNYDQVERCEDATPHVYNVIERPAAPPINQEDPWTQP